MSDTPAALTAHPEAWKVHHHVETGGDKGPAHWEVELPRHHNVVRFTFDTDPEWYEACLNIAATDGRTHCLFVTWDGRRAAYYTVAPYASFHRGRDAWVPYGRPTPDFRVCLANAHFVVDRVEIVYAGSRDDFAVRSKAVQHATIPRLLPGDGCPGYEPVLFVEYNAPCRHCDRPGDAHSVGPLVPPRLAIPPNRPVHHVHHDVSA